MTWIFDGDPSDVQLIELFFSESEGSTTPRRLQRRAHTQRRVPGDPDHDRPSIARGQAGRDRLPPRRLGQGGVVMFDSGISTDERRVPDLVG